MHSYALARYSPKSAASHTPRLSPFLSADFRAFFSASLFRPLSAYEKAPIFRGFVLYFSGSDFFLSNVSLIIAYIIGTNAVAMNVEKIIPPTMPVPIA